MEKLYGPYHTNGVFSSSGFIFFKQFNPKFYGPVSYTKGVKFTWGRPIFYQGISQVEKINYPTSNNELKLRAQNGGYYYEGRTSIMLNGNGTITIRNPNINNGKSQNNLPLPSNGVVYVDGAVVSHGNRFAKNSGNAFVSGTLCGRLTIASSNDIFITGADPTKWIPKRSIWDPSTWSPTICYYNDIPKTQGITYKATDFSKVEDKKGIIGYHATGNDMLGLVANNNIWMLSFGWFREDGESYSGIFVYPQNLTIDGALFAINGTFGHYEWFDLNIFAHKLIIRGAVIQKSASKVGTILTGYTKDYAHDDRMLYEAPPHFPSPEESGWEIIEWNETRDHLIGS